MAVNEPTEENTTKTKTFKTRIKHKRDTSANWESRNPVLLNGEVIIVDTANGETRTKTGDGTKTYTQLPFDDEGTKGGKSLIDKSFADKVSTSGNTTTIDNQLKTYSITTRLEADVAITGLDENGQEVIKHKLSEKANSSDVLTKTNTSEFTPTADYQPATKKYVDNNKLSNIANGETTGTIKIGRTGGQRTDGPFSTVIGFSGHTSADAIGSIAMGNSECLASYTVAMGSGTAASGENQLVQGQYNVKDTENKYAHIIGNGTSDTARSNAHTVDWNGNAWFSGGAKIGGASYDDASAKELATKEYVDSKSSDLSNHIVVDSNHNSIRLATYGEGSTYGWQFRNADDLTLIHPSGETPLTYNYTNGLTLNSIVSGNDPDVIVKQSTQTHKLSKKANVDDVIEKEFGGTMGVNGSITIPHAFNADKNYVKLNNYGILVNYEEIENFGNGKRPDITLVAGSETHKLSEKANTSDLAKKIGTGENYNPNASAANVINLSGLTKAQYDSGEYTEGSNVAERISGIKFDTGTTTNKAQITIGSDSGGVNTVVCSRDSIVGMQNGFEIFGISVNDIWCGDTTYSTMPGEVHYLKKKWEGKTYTISVPITDWTEKTDSENQKYYYKKITVSNMTAYGQAMKDVAMSDDVATARKQMEAYQCINRVVTGEGYVELYCFDEIPTTAFTLRVLVIGAWLG